MMPPAPPHSTCENQESTSIQDRIHNHPCYSEKAHHHYARLHLAVAPACNIQCNYCNRKYQCANESRPGVVSELLTPAQALKKTLLVSEKLPQLSVVGIAGPGDPLANPQRVFSVFKTLATQAPDLRLCISTNGLALPEWVDELARYSVEHVTVTINCIDPEIGAQIYPWIFWKNRRYKGIKAAEILLAQQQKGLKMLVERGMLVKVNSILIPGINDHHLPEVNRFIKQTGAFLHNITPLIAKAEHGTYYGLTRQREPSPEELLTVRQICGENMNVMHHCRQCRADAVGLLGEDRNAEFTLADLDNHPDIDHQAVMQKRMLAKTQIQAALTNPTANYHIPLSSLKTSKNSLKKYRSLLVAVATRGQGLINEHFGHAKEFLIYEASAQEIKLLRVHKTQLYCTGQQECDEAETRMHNILQGLAGCELLLCAKIGYAPWKQLEAAGIQPNSEYAMVPITQAIANIYAEFKQAGKLTLSSQQQAS